MRQLVTVADLKNKLSEILSKSLFEREAKNRSEEIGEIIERGNMDYLLDPRYKRVLRLSLEYIYIYEPYTGSRWQISTDLLTIFVLSFRKIVYSDLVSMREDLLKKGGTKTQEDVNDYNFVTQFLNMYKFCNLINYKIYNLGGVLTSNIDPDEVERLLSDPDNMRSDLVLDWLSENLGIDSIQPTCLINLKYGERYF